MKAAINNNATNEWVCLQNQTAGQFGRDIQFANSWPRESHLFGLTSSLFTSLDAPPTHSSEHSLCSSHTELPHFSACHTVLWFHAIANAPWDSLPCLEPTNSCSPDKNRFLSEAFSGPRGGMHVSVCSLCACLYSLCATVTRWGGCAVMGTCLFHVFSSRLSLLFSAAFAALPL